jgi:3-oxoadipate enol-lactonase
MTLVWLQDLRLNAELSGPPTAPPVVLIHGQGLDLRLWDRLLPALSRHRVLRCDLRGHGASDAPPAPCTLGTLIRDVERLIDHFALKDAVVAGLGEGGLIAQGLAVKRLDLVRALVLTGTAPRLPPRPEPADPLTLMPLLLGPRWRDQPDAALVQGWLSATPAAGIASLAAAAATSDLYQTTATLTLPTLVLAGAEDRKVPPDMQRELAELMAGAEFHLLRGAGHLAMLTHAEAFAAQLTAFLSRIGHV